MTTTSRHSALGLAARPDVRVDQTAVRRANLGVVLRHVADQGRCSRAAVAAGTGLTRGTVSSLVAELIEHDLLHEVDSPPGPPRIGRPSVALEVSGTVGAIGLEVNVDDLAVCLEDLRGEVRFERRDSGDNRGADPGAVIDRVARLAADALAFAEAEEMRVAGIAVALPGLVSGGGSGTLLRAPNLGWSELDIAAELGERLGTALPIRLDNEANLASIAEHWRGAADGVRSFVLVFGEVGVGGGVFVDGELFRGTHGYGGEIGHLTVDPNGPTCACGSRGCLEALVGQEAIARNAGIDTPIGAGSWVLCEELVHRATAGDPQTLAALGDAAMLLGTALATTINLFDLEAVVLGGVYGTLAPWLVEGVEDALREHVLAARWNRPEVRISFFGAGAAVRGAAAVTLRAVLASPAEATLAWTTRGVVAS